VFAASLVAKRWGHAAGGWLAGLPMIGGPIVGLLMVEVGTERGRDACLATLRCHPALVAYLVTYAWAARRWRWPACLGLSLSLFFVLGALCIALDGPEWSVVLLSVLAVCLGSWFVNRLSAEGAAIGRVELPRAELWSRVAAAVVMAGVVIGGASQLPVAAAGLLLAVPISGLILPCFTLPRHGAAATVALLRGFVVGQIGFSAFFIAMLASLPALPGALAWTIAMFTAAAMPVVVQRMRTHLEGSASSPR
jgi:MFS family permease